MAVFYHFSVTAVPLNPRNLSETFTQFHPGNSKNLRSRWMAVHHRRSPLPRAKLIIRNKPHNQENSEHPDSKIDLGRTEDIYVMGIRD